MKLIDQLTSPRLSLSFEVFPLDYPVSLHIG